MLLKKKGIVVNMENSAQNTKCNIDNYKLSSDGNKQRLDIIIYDGSMLITRNFTDNCIINTGDQKGHLALLDALKNPGKYEVQIHDSREKNVYSTISFEIK